MNIIPTLISIQVSLPMTLGYDNAADEMDRPWCTGFFKQPVNGPVLLHQDHLEGDGQADLRNHGGIDKSILAYCASHYPYWQKFYPDLMLPYGSFGENFTIEGLSETMVCIGDIYQIGEVQVQVSQPRIPCWKISRRWKTHGLTEHVQNSGFTGWYFRVLKTGSVEAGMDLLLVSRPFPEYTAATLSDLLNHRLEDQEMRSALADCPALAESWREMFRPF